MSTNDAAERLNALLAEETPPLDRVLAVIASVDDGMPTTEAEVVVTLDELADGVRNAEATAAGVLAEVHGTMGFTGDLSDYYDPANSLIHRVIERRRGIPLTLAAVACEIGRRLEVDLRPIGMPGHVLLGEGSEPRRWFDPFGGGAELGYDDCRLLFARFHAVEAFNPAMLRPLPPEGLAIRTLNNLRIAYANRGEAAKTIPVLGLRAEMSSAGLSDRLELANLLAGLGRFPAAADQYQRLAELDAGRREDYLARALTCRAHSN